jgi:hypothetical protein
VAVKGARRGTGITAKVVPALVAGDAEDTRGALHDPVRDRTFEKRIANFEAVAKEILKTAKFDKGALILTEDEEDTPAHFAERILRLISVVRAAIKRGDADEATFFAVTLGGLITESDLKVEHEAAWETGDKQRRTLRDIRERANTKRHALREREWASWNQEAAQVWKNQPNHKPSAVANIIKKTLKLNEGVRSIARRLKKPAQAGYRRTRPRHVEQPASRSGQCCR